MAPTMSEHEKALELMNREMQTRLELQFTVGDRVDTKATLLLGFVGLAVQFFLTHPHRGGLLAALALAALGVSFAAGGVALWLRTYAVVPEPRWLTNEYAALLAAGHEDVARALLGKLVGRRTLAIESNTKVDKRKARAWWVSLGALAVGLALATASVAMRGDENGRRESCAKERQHAAGSPASCRH